jgi:hypothetical protein
MITKEYTCLSVVGGWQTFEVDSRTGVAIGPVGPAFHVIQDLWVWQRENLSNLY